MKYRILPALVASALCLDPLAANEYGVPTHPPTAPVRLNTLGFRPCATKQATVPTRADHFEVIRCEDRKVMLSGAPGPVVSTLPTDTGEHLKIADFSALREPGRYQLVVRGVDLSPEFLINDHLYAGACRAVARGFFLWRCGTEISNEWDGKSFRQMPCHTEDGRLDFLKGKTDVRRDGKGGWHDAGDYNKYVVNAAFSMGMMFRAWEQFRPALQNLALNLPESGKGMPDLLAELRYETEWLFKMQLQDGSVSHKLSATDFSYWGPADRDRSPRYFSPPGSAATAGFAAVMALGARHFREFEPALADRCLQAALGARAWLAAHPAWIEPDQSSLRTGTYPCRDDSYRLWADQELWEATGDPKFLNDFEARSEKFSFSPSGPSWGAVQDLALSGYLLGARSKGKSLRRIASIRDDLFRVARLAVETARSNPHGRGIGGEKASFFWGCNGNVAGQCLLLFAADQLSPDPLFSDTAELCVGYLFGRNYHGRSYVTGLGHNPPEHTHDRRGSPQLPGYLVGGPWPTAREYIDSMPDASRNEIAINWNASLFYALAGLLPR